ncbi:MAG: hypothetical protein PHU80_06935, partial [Kiritimatiellae bacterium]|nr:hypothetical protein [Kiritimatiellia bacterium]
MNKVTLKTVLSCLCGIVCLNAMAVEPSVSQATVRQRWPWSRLVDIDYVLSADPDTAYDIQIQAFNGELPLDIPANAFSGHLYNVSEGARRIVFDPTKTAYTNSEIMTQFKVSITPTAPAVYMIIDLTQSPGAAGQIEYVYEDDLHAGTYGAVETNFVAGIESLIWTGVTNNSAYKDQKMVLRRVRAGSVTPASGSAISVSKDFYIAVFETTQNQWM